MTLMVRSPAQPGVSNHEAEESRALCLKIILRDALLRSSSYAELLRMRQNL
jgi:hypothetical protein